MQFIFSLLFSIAATILYVFVELQKESAFIFIAVYSCSSSLL
jgi:hypothetical protein